MYGSMLMKAFSTDLAGKLPMIETARQASQEAVKRSRAAYLQSQRLLADIDSIAITDLPVTWGMPVAAGPAPQAACARAS